MKVTRADVAIRLPGWMTARLEGAPGTIGSLDERMRLVIDLARLNIEHGTGGPFAAAVFDDATGALLAAGVNLVVSSNCSAAHAEIVALAVAQQALGSYDLGAPGLPACQLVTSTEPCAMCLGAIPWSGVRSVVCGARGEDARRIGMDEGAKPANWEAELRRRGIDVRREVCRAEAAAVLEQYARSGGPIYNGRTGAAGAR